MSSTFGGAWRLANWLFFHHPMNVILRPSFLVVTSCCLQKVTVIMTGRTAYIFNVIIHRQHDHPKSLQTIIRLHGLTSPKIILPVEMVVTFVIFYIRAFGTVQDFDEILTPILLHFGCV